MKKVYFISPNDYSLEMWYTTTDDNDDVSSWKSLNTGYNDSYEMRSVRISPKYFSDDYNKLLPILEERRKNRVADTYKKIDEMIKSMQRMSIPTEKEVPYYDCFDSPL